MQQGMVQGLLEGIELALDVKFGMDGLGLMPQIRKFEDADRLKRVKEGIKMAKDLSELKSLISKVDHLQ